MHLKHFITLIALCMSFGCDDDPSRSGAPLPTPTVAALGKRRLQIQPSTSPVLLALGGDAVLRLGNFMGQSGGVDETGFVELEAGSPDPQTGIARVAVTAASEYLYALLPSVRSVFCVKLDVPATDAGAIDCDGGSDFSVHLQIDHHVGDLGVDGFDVEACTAAGGTIEGAGRICRRGQPYFECRANADCDTAPAAGDGRCGLVQSTCTAPPRKVGDNCRNDSDCDRGMDSTRGRCGTTPPHLGVCNGPLLSAADQGDSGPGALTFAPRADLGLNGLPGRFIIEDNLPCGDEGEGMALTFALTSAVAAGTIQNFSDNLGQTLDFTMAQSPSATPAERELQNFSCGNWTDGDGPGCLGLVVPTLDLNPANGGDLLPAFKFCGR